MAVESWITFEETPVLAEAASALIEAKLSRFSPAERAAFWVSVRKCYNTPYNPPAPRAAKASNTVRNTAITIALPEAVVIEMPLAAIPTAAPPAVEVQAA